MCAADFRSLVTSAVTVSKNTQFLLRLPVFEVTALTDAAVQYEFLWRKTSFQWGTS